MFIGRVLVRIINSSVMEFYVVWVCRDFMSALVYGISFFERGVEDTGIGFVCFFGDRGD